MIKLFSAVILTTCMELKLIKLSLLLFPSIKTPDKMKPTAQISIAMG